MYKVLVIEDHDIIRENIAELLVLSNYEVIMAPNGEAGIDMAKKHMPDIILCDIMMPKLDGYEVLKALAKDKLTLKIPFIFLSAKTERSDIRTGMNLGADDYITKPFKEEDLLNAIESRLAKISILNEKDTAKGDNQDKFQLKNFNDLKNYIVDHYGEIFYKASDSIYNEGSRANFVYLVYSGIVKTYRIDEKGKELITDVLKADDFFGITSFSENGVYQENAKTLVDATIVKISKTDFKELIGENTNVTLGMIDYINSSLATTKKQLLNMAYGSVRKKTAECILKFTKRINKSPDNYIRISRNDLANVAGITTESLVRTLSEFKKSGIIETEGRNIKIIDLDKLKNIE